MVIQWSRSKLLRIDGSGNLTSSWVRQLTFLFWKSRLRCIFDRSDCMSIIKQITVKGVSHKPFATTFASLFYPISCRKISIKKVQTISCNTILWWYPVRRFRARQSFCTLPKSIAFLIDRTTSYISVQCVCTYVATQFITPTRFVTRVTNHVV